MKVKIYNQQGKAIGEQELAANVYGVRIRPTVVHQVVVDMQAQAREPWAHTKTIGEVRGGGKKPWKQKGTGRARQGSIRSPQWAGGAVIFGPRSERNYDRKINRKTKKLAFTMALSDKLASDKLVLVDDIKIADGKTREMAKTVKNLPTSGRVVVVVPGRDEMVSRASRNLQKVRLVNIGSVSILDVLNAETLVMTVDAAKKLEKTYGTK